MYQRVLICDDMIYSRAMLKNILDQLGSYIFVEAENREELFKKINDSNKKNRDFDFVFIDLEMKRENGLDMLKQLRETNPFIEVILCGGISLTDENIAKGMQLGVKKFIPKPYKLQEVSLILGNN